MTESDAEDLQHGLSLYQDELRQLLDECKGDYREFGRLCARFAALPVAGDNVPS